MTQQYVAVTIIGTGFPIVLHICQRNGHTVASDGSFQTPPLWQFLFTGAVAAERIGLGEVVEITGGRGMLAGNIGRHVGLPPPGFVPMSASGKASSPRAADALIADALGGADPDPKPKPAYEPDNPGGFDADHLWNITMRSSS